MDAIPGTDVLFAVITPTGVRPPLRNKSEEVQRRGLLAMVHIAKKDLALNEGEYEMILRGFKVASSGELTIAQLERLVKYLKRLGWKPFRRTRRKKERQGDDPETLAALRRRVREDVLLIRNGENRFPGLLKSATGAEALDWVHDVRKLERLLAVLGKIKKMEGIS